MKYEWDESKRIKNIVFHGVDFYSIEDFEWNRSLIFDDNRKDYGESRYIAFAPIENRLHCAVFTNRYGNIRLISLRKANPREVKLYERTRQTDPSNR